MTVRTVSLSVLRAVTPDPQAISFASERDCKFRADNRPAPLAILLTRVVPRAVSTTVYRESRLLADEDLSAETIADLRREGAR